MAKRSDVQAVLVLLAQAGESGDATTVSNIETLLDSGLTVEQVGSLSATEIGARALDERNRELGIADELTGFEVEGWGDAGTVGAPTPAQAAASIEEADTRAADNAAFAINELEQTHGAFDPNTNTFADGTQVTITDDGRLLPVFDSEEGAGGVSPGGVSPDVAAQIQSANQRAGLAAGQGGFSSLVGALAPLTQAGTAANRLQADILARPADFATRALQIRGGTPDFAETTQADLINRLGGFMRAINEQLAGFQQRPVTGFGISGPPVVPPPATASRTTVPSDGTSEWDAEGQRDIMEQRAAGAYDGIPSWARADWMIPRTPAEIAAAEAAAFDQEQRDREEASRPPFVATSPVVTPDIFNTAETPGISTEDFFRQHAAMFPVDTPESIYGRQGAGVTNEETTLEHGGFANRAIVGDSSDGKENPELVEALPGGGFRVTPVDKKRISKRVSRAQDGGTFGDLGLLGTLPGVPEIGTVTQDQIQESALGVAQGTGFGDIFAGQRPAPLQFGHVGGGFKLPTAIGLGSLTPDERTAFGSLLATRNTSLGDVETAVRQRFARPNTRPLATLRSRGF